VDYSGDDLQTHTVSAARVGSAGVVCLWAPASFAVMRRLSAHGMGCLLAEAVDKVNRVAVCESMSPSFTHPPTHRPPWDPASVCTANLQAEIVRPAKPAGVSPQSLTDDSSVPVAVAWLRLSCEHPLRNPSVERLLWGNTTVHLCCASCVQAMLLMDVHVHLSGCEVIGLLGGTWQPDKRLLTITDAYPCRCVDQDGAALFR
jgi:hypothetical protein